MSRAAAIKAELHRAWLTIEKLESELLAYWKTQSKQKACSRCSRKFTHHIGQFTMPGRLRELPLDHAAGQAHQEWIRDCEAEGLIIHDQTFPADRVRRKAK